MKNQGGNLPTVAHCHKKMLFILVCFWIIFFFSTVAVNVSVIPCKGKGMELLLTSVRLRTGVSG